MQTQESIDRSGAAVGVLDDDRAVAAAGSGNAHFALRPWLPVVLRTGNGPGCIELALACAQRRIVRARPGTPVWRYRRLQKLGVHLLTVPPCLEARRLKPCTRRSFSYFTRSRVTTPRPIPRSGLVTAGIQSEMCWSRSPSILKVRICSLPTHAGFHETSTFVIILSPSTR